LNASIKEWNEKIIKMWGNYKEAKWANDKMTAEM